jgi:hypothetical protein
MKLNMVKDHHAIGMNGAILGAKSLSRTDPDIQ